MNKSIATNETQRRLIKLGLEKIEEDVNLNFPNDRIDLLKLKAKIDKLIAKDMQL